MRGHIEPKLLPSICDAVIKHEWSNDIVECSSIAGLLAMGSIGDATRPLGRRGIGISMQNHLRLDSFELSLSDIASIDVNMLHALSLGVSWPHRPEDWNMLRQVGEGFAATDGIGRVFGTAMWFSHGTDFATVGMVITSPRLQAQGNRRWLMDRVLVRCGGGRLILDATSAACPLCMSLGFVPEAHVYKCRGGEATKVPSVRRTNGEVRAT